MKFRYNQGLVSGKNLFLAAFGLLFYLQNIYVTEVYAQCSGTYTVSNVSLNGGGSSVTVGPSDNVTLNFNYSVSNSSSCPSCIKQIVIGWTSQAIECAYNGIPATCPSTTSSTYSTTITAPASAGTYGIFATSDLQFNCNDALTNYTNTNTDTNWSSYSGCNRHSGH